MYCEKEGEDGEENCGVFGNWYGDDYEGYYHCDDEGLCDYCMYYDDGAEECGEYEMDKEDGPKDDEDGPKPDGPKDDEDGSKDGPKDDEDGPKDGDYEGSWDGSWDDADSDD